ncbi:MAG: HAD family hydrolase [Geothrix sp.]|uniref:HAD family hydrolase n=1 Tax=Geothrix sp. TaxID=1962974 RepID=UPI00183A2EF4|nr:HAD family hydrolase [Geothrix sp.]NWJ41511.1 HAD family hydrolase [Geothrix sp.]WIL20504.1 MAG: HAD family hydrolase [Geothrix sp.]
MKLIAWDFDGTLVDSRPLIEAGMAHALDALGQPRSVMAEWLKYVGLPVEAGIRHTFEPLGLDGPTVLKAYRSFGHAEHEHMMQPFEGIPELLVELKGRGQRMAVVTSKRRLPLLRQMAQWDWEPLFDPIITPDEVTHGKPHPESLEQLQARTGLAAEDILMVGDTPFDLDMARAAGVPSLAVGHGFYDQEALAACGPRAYAPDTAALRDILLAWSE